jgi:hypothetical protein
LKLIGFFPSGPIMLMGSVYSMWSEEAQVNNACLRCCSE